MILNSLLKERKNSAPSSGEQFITNYLRKLKIKFKREYFFEDCVNPKTKHCLFFDFYIPSLNLIIELDGKHHFEAIDGDNDALKYIQFKDEVKDKYCSDKNITLCRLMYSDLKEPFDKLTKYVGKPVFDIKTKRIERYKKNTVKKDKKQKTKKNPSTKLTKSQREVIKKRAKVLATINRVKESNQKLHQEICKKRLDGRSLYMAKYGIDYNELIKRKECQSK